MQRGELYKQASLLASLGAGMYFLKSFSKTNHCTNDLFASTPYIRKHPNLARVLTKLEGLQDPLLPHLVSTVESILEHAHCASVNPGTSASERCARIVNTRMTVANDTVEVMMQNAKRSGDDDVLSLCVDVADEEIPAMQNIFESILHNVMLDSFR